MNLTDTFALIALLAFINERLVEHLLSPIAALKGYLLYVSMLTGVVLGVTTGVDVVSPVFAQFGAEPPVHLVAVVLTAILIGGGSQVLHDVISRVNSKGVIS